MTTCSLNMDPIEHTVDESGSAIIDIDNLPLTLHELSQALTKDSYALDIETIGHLVGSGLRPFKALFMRGVAILDFGDRVAFETIQFNI